VDTVLQLCFRQSKAQAAKRKLKNRCTIRKH